MSEASASSKPKARDLNKVIRYAMWSVFALDPLLGESDRPELADEVDDLVAQLAEKDVVVRGFYDVAGLRADADLMVWWHAETSDALQEAYHRLRRTRLGRAPAPGVVAGRRCTVRPSSTRATSRPSWPTSEPAPTCACTPSCAPTSGTCCPTRSAARCWSSTVRWVATTPTCAPTPSSSFALGDYEWILAFEADELHRIVDLMRHLRASSARLHVREEIPFYTGPRREIADLVAVLP